MADWEDWHLDCWAVESKVAVAMVAMAAAGAAAACLDKLLELPVDCWVEGKTSIAPKVRRVVMVRVDKVDKADMARIARIVPAVGMVLVAECREDLVALVGLLVAC